MIDTRTATACCNIAILGTTLVFALAGGSAHGEDLPVTTTDDHLDFSCDAFDCSLRDAVWQANQPPLAPDVIWLPAGTFTLTLQGAGEDDAATGDLDIRDAVIIGGAGAGNTVIDASGLGDRVFHVKTPGFNIGLALMTITGGNRDHPSNPVDGGGIYHEGGNLTLSGVTVADNEGGHGSGIYVFNSILIVQDGSFIAGNTASLGGADGGGIFVESSDLTVTDSTIMANHATRRGGAISVAASTASISGSTLSYNSAGGASDGGGGLYVHSVSSAGVDVANSTIYGNSTAGTGGAIYVRNAAKVALSGVTIADNPADLGEAVYVAGDLDLVNTIISGSCELGTGAAVISFGGNLESPLASCSLDPPPGQVDQVGVADAMLSTLGHFGGGTATVMPLTGSVAIDNANDSGCWPRDQRGLARPAGAHCDIGAVERQGPLFFDNFESGDTLAW